VACKPDLALTERKPLLDRSRICGVLVRLDVEGEKFLFLRLGADGSIQRLGTTEREILRGTASPDLFERVVQKVTPQLLRWKGQSWSDPAPKGKICLLVVGFKEIDGQEVLMRWEYGSESHEPPPEILEFVISAVEATNPWFGEQKVRNRIRKTQSRKDGWQLVPLLPA
jgi:hypothetical protein